MRASQGVRRALDQLPSDHFVDITETFECKVAAVRAQEPGWRCPTTARGTVREQIASLARRARLGLPPETATKQPHGITGPTAREAWVLRLIAAGRDWSRSVIQVLTCGFAVRVDRCPGCCTLVHLRHQVLRIPRIRPKLATSPLLAPRGYSSGYPCAAALAYVSTLPASFPLARPRP